MEWVYANSRTVEFFMGRGSTHPDERILEWGLLLRKRIVGLTEYKHQITPVDGGFQVTFLKRGQPRLALVVDPAVGCRITEERQLWGGKTTQLRKLKYKDFGGTLFLGDCTTTDFDADGAITEEEVFHVYEAEFSESLPPAELLMELRPGTRIRDQNTNSYIRLPGPVDAEDSPSIRMTVTDIAEAVVQDGVQRERRKQMEGIGQ